MPISREEFEQGIIDLSLPIAQILRTRPDLAFSVDELVMMITETIARIATQGEVQLALNSLIAQNVVEVKELEGQRWYTVVEPRERRLGFHTE